MIEGFKTELCIRSKCGSDKVWVLDESLGYFDLFDGFIEVPAGFETDLASVPRVPVIWMLWGDRAHREAVLHDYLYRADSFPDVTRERADTIFLDAMKSRGVAWWIRYPMYLGVRCGGSGSYHKKFVADVLC